MRIVIAPDSFKECASAAAVADAMREGVRRAVPCAEVRCVPMADGGEGTVDALVAATDGEYAEKEVTGPLGGPVRARYGMLGGGKAAVIEMAAASGLALVAQDKRDPLRATTRGTGELIADALNNGATRIIIGIGGSATNDGGTGMARALGYRFLDESGAEIEEGGGALHWLARIDAGGRIPGLDACEVQVACDVDNPLCGRRGASQVYGPQKGADAEAVAHLDACLRHLAGVLKEQLGADVLDMPGAGAAGGLGAGLVAFAGGALRSGVELVADACGLEEHIEGAGLVLTGEGALDGQTANGKTPAGVARLARHHGVPVVALAGTLGRGYEALYAEGVTAAFSICPAPVVLSEAMERAGELIETATESVVRLWYTARMEHA